jgi:hypothetical protein
MISSIGFTTNLEALLKSGADSISPLTGFKLVEQKVKGIAWMGGRYPTSQSINPGSPTWKPGVPEHNFGFHNIGSSTNFTLSRWPSSVPITFLGFEVGNIVLTGGIMTNSTPANNPCRRAYIVRVSV